MRHQPVGSSLEPEIIEPETLEHVGGRRHIRVEFVAIGLGVLFLGVALLKPWSFGQPQPNLKSTGLVAAQTTTPAGDRAAGDPAIDSGLIGPFAPLDELAARWAAVDWTLLAQPDRHAGWGMAFVTMTDLATQLDGANPAPPKETWVRAASKSRMTFAVSTDQAVYAFALTWPKNVGVNSVTFEFEGAQLLDPGSGVFLPYTPLSPLSSAAVTNSPAAVAQGGFIGSGQFWLSPSDVATPTYSGSPAQVWHFLPWSWPSGCYKITASGPQGSTTISLRIQGQ